MKMHCYTMATVMVLGVAVHAQTKSLADRTAAALAEPGLSNLTTITAEAATLLPHERNTYYKYIDQAGAALEVVAKTNLNARDILITHSVVSLGSHCPDDPSLAVGCFPLKASIACRLERLSRPSPRASVAEALAGFLGEVRATAISNYQRAEVTPNVMPPIIPKSTTGTNYGLYFPGMDPAAIPDPSARNAYEKARSQNSQRAHQNDLQLVILPRIEREIKVVFFEYVQNLCRTHSKEMENVGRLASVARLTESECKTLLERVSLIKAQGQ